MRPLFPLLFLFSLNALADRPPARSDPGGVLPQLNFAAFAASGQTSIQATAVDAGGNVYVTGTTTSANFPTKNAAQPNFGEATILRTTDLGVTWTRIASPPDPNLYSVIPDPVTPDVLYASGYLGFYKTTDAGQSWSLIYRFSPGVSWNVVLVVDPSNHLRLAAIPPSGSAVIRSVDGGQTWTQGAPCGTTICGGQLLADPSGSGALLSVSLSGFYLSRDWGLTFQPLTPLEAGGPSTAAFDPSHPGWIYAATSQGVRGSLSLSVNFGASWTIKASPPTTFSMIENLAVDPSQPNTLIAITADGLYKSSDGASSWTLQGDLGASFRPEGTFPFVILNHSCAPAGGLFAIGSGPGFFEVAFSADYGMTWMPPHVTQATSIVAGPGCAMYATRQATSDAFVAKIAPDGTELWATYLGGSDQDAPVGLVLDSEGNAYVTGNTTSTDFPVTLPPIGVEGESAVFVTKYSASGTVEYSVLLEGEADNTALAIALDPGGRNVYIAGGTDSQSFPLTSGTLFTTLTDGSYTGFLVKLSAAGALMAGTFLGESYTFADALIVDSNADLIVAGTGPAPGLPAPPQGGDAFLAKLDPALSRVLSSTYLPAGAGAPSALAFDAQGNLLIFGETTSVTATPGAYSSPLTASTCGTSAYGNENGGEVYLTKLGAANWTPIYTAMLQAPCGLVTGAIAVDSTGASILALGTGGGFPLHNPLLAGPSCAVNSSAIAKLSADGSSLLFATYLDACGIPAIAAGPNGSIYAGVAPSRPDNPAGVLRVSIPSAPAISLDRIANAFSGDASAIVAGGLYTLTGTGFQFPVIDLGLNSAKELPTALGGVQVIVDGVPAPLLQTGSGRVIAVVPPLPGGRLYSAPPGFQLVQVVANGVASNAVWMPESTSLPGLLTVAFPQAPAPSGPVDGVVRNQDGTLNTLDNPAAAGSTITVFVTGIGAPPVYSTWQMFDPMVVPVPQPVSSIPGFVSSMFQVQVQVPAAFQYLYGTPEANGVQQVLLGLQFQVFPEYAPPASNLIAVYLK
jgi:uncharacterized protein (TIGR03437 family)